MDQFSWLSWLTVFMGRGFRVAKHTDSHGFKASISHRAHREHRLFLAPVAYGNTRTTWLRLLSAKDAKGTVSDDRQQTKEDSKSKLTADSPCGISPLANLPKAGFHRASADHRRRFFRQDYRIYRMR
jgi:hypothetical protein